MKIYIQINKAMTNIFGLRTHPRKTTRYNNILKLVGGGGGGEGKRAPHTKYCGLKIWIWLSLWVKNMNLIIVGINQYGTGSPLDVNRNI